MGKAGFRFLDFLDIVFPLFLLVWSLILVILGRILGYWLLLWLVAADIMHTSPGNGGTVETSRKADGNRVAERDEEAKASRIPVLVTCIADIPITRYRSRFRLVAPYRPSPPLLVCRYPTHGKHPHRITQPNSWLYWQTV